MDNFMPIHLTAQMKWARALKTSLIKLYQQEIFE